MSLLESIVRELEELPAPKLVEVSNYIHAIHLGKDGSDKRRAAILGTASWAAGLWQDKPLWQQLQKNAMAGDLSWAGPAQRYLDLYRSLLPA